jgi:hypothetical protein
VTNDRNSPADSRIWRGVKAFNDPSGFSPRALRLKIEAGNCLTIAVRQEDPAFAGELIDEAIKLARRARELDKTSSSAAKG